MGDFGLATALPQEQNDVLYGSENCLYKKHTAQVGTQLYMSPEQVSRELVNPLHTNEFFHLVCYNEPGMVHCHIRGLQVRISKLRYTSESVLNS